MTSVTGPTPVYIAGMPGPEQPKTEVTVKVIIDGADLEQVIRQVVKHVLRDMARTTRAC